MDMDYDFGSHKLSFGNFSIKFGKKSGEIPLTQYILGATQPLLDNNDPHKKAAMKDLCAAIDELHKSQRGDK